MSEREDRKYSLTVRVDHVTPAHVTISIFSGLIPVELDHDQATRGRCGELTMRNEEFPHFIEKVQPHLITLREGVSPEVAEEELGLIPARVDTL